MKRIFILLLMLFPLALCIAKAKPKLAEPESEFTDYQKTQYVSAKSPTLVVKLQSTPSTGFIWILKQSDRNLLKLAKHHYTPSKENLPGAPGVDTWVFNANLYNFTPGQRTDLVFIHAQPWNLHEQISVRKFRVVRR